MISWIRAHRLIILLTICFALGVYGVTFWFGQHQSKDENAFAERAAPIVDTKNSVLITIPYTKKENQRVLFVYSNTTQHIQEVELPINDVSNISSSANGETLVLRAHGADPGIFVYLPLNGTIRKLPIPAEADEPFLSPVSPWVYYILNGDTYAMHMDTRGIRHITDDSATDSAPVMSPDGRTLAISSENNNTKELRIVTMDPQTADVLSSRTLQAYSSAKSISHDGNRLYLGDEHRIIDMQTGESLYTFTPADGIETLYGGGAWTTDDTLIYSEWTDTFAEVNIRSLSPDFQQNIRYMIFAFTQPKELRDTTTFNTQAHMAIIP